MSYQISNITKEFLRFDAPEQEVALGPGESVKLKKISPFMERLEQQQILTIKREQSNGSKLSSRRRNSRS